MQEFYTIDGVSLTKLKVAILLLSVWILETDKLLTIWSFWNEDKNSDNDWMAWCMVLSCVDAEGNIATIVAVCCVVIFNLTEILCDICEAELC